MLFRTKWLEVAYEARFKKPSFGFVASPMVVMESLYEAISPRYPLTSSDLTIDHGRAISEVRARATLFNGNAAIEVTADGFSGTFRNPVAPGDLQTVQDCLTLASDAIAQALSDVTLAHDTLTVRLFAELLEELLTRAHIGPFDSRPIGASGIAA